MKSKAGLHLPNWSSFVSGLQKPSSPLHISSSSSVSTIPSGLQKPSSPPHISSSSSVPIIPITTVPPLIMVAPTRYAPPVLPAVLHDLPSKYDARIPTWGSDEEITAEEHVDRFNDFVDREEVDDEDVKLRHFAQSFIGEVRKWFKALTPGSIRNWAEFEDNFLRKWGNRTNSVQALIEYNSLKRASDENVQDFSKRFNKVFNSIPAHLKPSEALAQMRYAEAFDYKFSLLLRERESPTLAKMQADAVKVEVDMIAAKKSKMGKIKLKEEEKPSSSTSEDKLDSMMKTLEKLMDRLALGNTSTPPVQHQPQFRNP